MSELQIMVVDDSTLMIKKLEALINTLGHKVVRSATSGEEAIIAYRDCKPDLVTMDITMPDMDGIEATRRILTEFPSARIIMVTSHGQEGMIREAIKAGALGYVMKPINPDRFQEHMKNALSR